MAAGALEAAIRARVRRDRRRRLLPAVTALVTAAVLLLGAAPARAHAAFVSSQPQAGSELAATPGVVTLRFSEPLIEELSHATVSAPTGETFTGGPVGGDVMRVELSGSAQGEYTVDWKTVSPLDGHTLRGSFRFGVGTPVGPPLDPSDRPASGDLLVAVARTLEYLGLLAIVGWLSLGALAHHVGSDWVPTGLRRWVALAVGGGVLTVVGELSLASTDAFAASARAFLSVGSGPARAGRLLVEVAALLLVVATARRTGVPAERHRPTRVWSGALTVAAIVLLSVAGHAGAGGWPAVLAGAGHLLAAGVWAGTIVVFAFQRPPDGWHARTGRRLLAGFVPAALTAFAATVVLGAIRGIQEVGTPHDLWATGYGLTLVLKSVVVALMVPLSLRAWKREAVAPLSEAALAGVVVILAALLAAYPVPPGRVADTDRVTPNDLTGGLPQNGDLTLAAGAGTTVVGVTVRPGEPGVNDLYVYLVPIGGVDEAGDLEVSLTVGGTGPATVRRCGVACRVATVSLAGAERIEVQVLGEGGGAASVDLPRLPAPPGDRLLTAIDERMPQLHTFAYDETFGPHQPPTRSSWRVVAPDRLHGVITRGGDYRETIRIADRRWNRDDADGDWEGGEPGGLTVTANRFIWDLDDRTAAHLVGTDTVAGIPTRVLSFHAQLSGGLPVWYRLWVDDDDLVRRAEMRTQGHFMDHRYHGFDEGLEIRPPT